MPPYQDPSVYPDEPGRRPSPRGKRGVARRIVHTEVYEVLADAPGRDEEEPDAAPDASGGGFREGLRAALGWMRAVLGAAGDEDAPALPSPRGHGSAGSAGVNVDRTEDTALSVEPALLEAQSRLDALRGRMARVRQALAEQRSRFDGPATPEAVEQVILVVGGLAEQMGRVVDEMRRERERMVHQVAELTGAVRSLREEMERLRAAASGPGREAVPGGSPVAGHELLPPVVTVVASPLQGFDRALLLRANLLQRAGVQAAVLRRYDDGAVELQLTLERPRTVREVCDLLSAAAARTAEPRTANAAGLLQVALA